MPIIEVKLWAGRTREQKAELARRFTEAMVEVVGCPPKAVTDHDRVIPAFLPPRTLMRMRRIRPSVALQSVPRVSCP